MNLRSIIIDPEFQKLIPPLTSDERSDLEASLIADGCISPLIVWREHDILLDGHNRHEFCLKHGIECRVHEIAMASREDAKAWIIKHQLGRRNLNPSQRAMLATSLEKIFATLARERQADGQRAGGHARHGDDSFQANLPESRQARDEAAEIMNVSPRLVQTAKKVAEEGSKKLNEAVLAGQVSVSAAAEVADLPKKKQDQLVDSGPDAVRDAARDIRNSRSDSSPSQKPGARRKCSLTEKQFAQLQDHVSKLVELTDVPSMQLSRIDIRKCVAEIVNIVLGKAQGDSHV